MPFKWAFARIWKLMSFCPSKCSTALQAAAVLVVLECVAQQHICLDIASLNIDVLIMLYVAIMTSIILLFMIWIVPCALQGLSISAAAMATMEFARVDASMGTFYLVHTFLSMLTIALMVSSTHTVSCKYVCSCKLLLAFSVHNVGSFRPLTRQIHLQLWGAWCHLL